MQQILVLSLFVVAVFAVPTTNTVSPVTSGQNALPANHTVPSLTEAKKAQIKQAIEQQLSALPQDKREEAVKLLQAIAKAVESSLEGLKTAVTKAFGNLTDAQKQAMMKVKANNQ